MPALTEIVIAMLAVAVALNINIREPITNTEVQWTEHQPWQQKIKKLWDEHLRNLAVQAPFPSSLQLASRLGIVGDEPRNIFRPSTFRDFGHKLKFFHSQGYTAQVVTQWSDSKAQSMHTGLFAEEEVQGFLRLSAGDGITQAPLGLMLTIPRSNFTPGVILGLQSVFASNVQRNIFRYLQCTQFSLLFFESIIATAMSRIPGYVGTRDYASVHTNGTIVEKPHYPFAICFRPNPKFAERVGDPQPGDRYYEDVSAQSEVVRSGEVVYEIIFIESPIVLEQPMLMQDENYVRVVGEIRAETQFSRSSFYDQRIKGVHFSFDRDLELRPEWLQYMTWRNLVYSDAGLRYKALLPTQTINDVEYKSPMEMLESNALNVMKDILQNYGNVSDPSEALRQTLEKALDPFYFDRFPQCDAVVNDADITRSCLEAVTQDLGEPFGIANESALVDLKTGFFRSGDPEVAYVSVLINAKAGEAHIYNFLKYWSRREGLDLDFEDYMGTDAID